jgi:argininosuccinate lyase
VDTLRETLLIFAEMIGGELNPQTGERAGGLQVNAQAMQAAVQRGYATATDLADYLVKRGMPFRDAHEVVAHAVKAAQTLGVDLAELSLAQLQQLAPSVQADVQQALTAIGAMQARQTTGGTAPEQVRLQLTRHLQRLNGQ